MYLEHFGLAEAPFMLTPNTQYFYKLEGHHAAFNVLMLHLRNGEGFIKITGKVGSGKTLLCRMLLENLDDRFFTAYIPNPDLESSTLRKSVALELGIAEENLSDPHKLIASINQRLIELHAQGKKVVLVIDEAQALPVESLETLRLFTNLETHSSKLLQIVLFGQPELEAKLNLKSLRQLKQRICFSYHLPLLKQSELNAYLHHRLKMAGFSDRKNVFTKLSQLYLFWKTKGVPRLINILCHKAMMSAYGRGKLYVTLGDMIRATKDTESIKPSQVPAILGITLAMAAGFALYFLKI